MGKLFDKATERNSLERAWRQIRANGFASSAIETRLAVEAFEQNSTQNIAILQRQVRDLAFTFDLQKGILKRKSSGNFRGIVMAPVCNRIVERALLDCLQAHSKLVRSVNAHPMSIGGVPQRSVPHGLQLLRDAFSSGKTVFVRSDISGFFDHVPRMRVIFDIAQDIQDDRFVDVLQKATTVLLANEAALGENRKVFPTADSGIAQGSPLSPLFGNILLHEFDNQLNDRGVTCIRFIDDFVLLSDNETKVRKAFASAKAMLMHFGMKCHDPYAEGAKADKASFGPVEKGFDFLGYNVMPGLYQPSRKSRQNLESTISKHLARGKSEIVEAKCEAEKTTSRQHYVQTLALVDKVVRGWGQAFAYSNARQTTEALDMRIEKQLDEFRTWFRRTAYNRSWQEKRRMGGVCLLTDVQPRSLDDVPFVLTQGSRTIRSPRAMTISTDGSLISNRGGRGKDQGPGGWAFVIHGSEELFGGHALKTTNNQMELRAIIEALKYVGPSRPLKLETDSQYVCGIVNKGFTIKSNISLWREFKELASTRELNVKWVRGHNGDVYNELADQHAVTQAKVAERELANQRRVRGYEANIDVAVAA